MFYNFSYELKNQAFLCNIHLRSIAHACITKCSSRCVCAWKLEHSSYLKSSLFNFSQPDSELLFSLYLRNFILRCAIFRQFTYYVHLFYNFRCLYNLLCTHLVDGTMDFLLIFGWATQSHNTKKLYVQ